MVNATVEKFGFPHALVREYEHWLVMVRPAQVTAGSLILAAKSDATAYRSLPQAAFTEQARVIAETEEMLLRAIKFEKINYLMLMMVDPHVHFHIFPRYRGDRSFAGLMLTDHGWPGPPDLKSAVELARPALEQSVGLLREGS